MSYFGMMLTQNNNKKNIAYLISSNRSYPQTSQSVHSVINIKIKQFSMKFPKAETKVIAVANHEGHKQYT